MGKLQATQNLPKTPCPNWVLGREKLMREPSAQGLDQANLNLFLRMHHTELRHDNDQPAAA